MTCARRPAGARKPAPSTSAGSRRPDARTERSRARRLSLFPALALLLGALSLFAPAPAQAANLTGLSLSVGGTGVTLAPAFEAGRYLYAAVVPDGTGSISVSATWSGSNLAVYVKSAPANGLTVLSGEQQFASSGSSRSVNLAGSGNTRVTVRTVDSSTSKTSTYIVTVGAVARTSGGPSNFHVSAATATSITVAWDGVGPGAAYETRIENLNPNLGQQFMIRTEPGFIAWQPRKFTWGPRYTWTGLTAGSTYRLQVRANTADAWGPWSRTFSVTVGTSAATPLVTFARTASGTFSGELRQSVTEGRDSDKPPCGSCGLTLNIAPQLSTASTVTVVPRPGTAEAGVDYSTAPFTVELPANKDTVRIPVPLIDNILSEDTKDVSFFLELEAVDGAPYAIGSDRRFEVGPIDDDDVVTVSFERNTQGMAEGIFRQIDLIIDKVADFPITVTVGAGADDDDDTANATDGVDYRLENATFTIPAGATRVPDSERPVLHILHDGVTENDEVLLVSIANVSAPRGGRVEAGPDPVTVTITNSIRFSLSASPNPVPEGSPVTVTVTASEAPASDISLPMLVSRGTAEATDIGTLANIAIATGKTTGTGTITTAQDADAEDETFTVRVRTAGSGADPVTVRILDDEAGARDLRIATPWVLPLKLEWQDPSSDPAVYEVHYTSDLDVAADAAAVAGTDPATGWVDALKHLGRFVASPGGGYNAYHFYSGDVKRGTEYRFRVRARYWRYSGTSRVGVRFSGWTHTSTVYGSGTAVGLFAFNGYESRGNAPVRVNLANPVSHEVTVDYATSAAATSPATAGTDYTAVSGTLTFAPGETEKWVNVPVTDDSISDSGEKFVFTLSNPRPSDKVRLGWSGFGYGYQVHPLATRAEVTIYNHEADLKALAVEGAPGEDGPWAALDIGAFAAETTDYAVTVPHGTTHARLTPTALHEKQRLRAGTGSNLQAVGSGAASAAIPLEVGENRIVVESFLSTEVQKTFTVTVTRQAAQAAVAVSLSATPNPVDEGSPVTVTATLAAALDEAVTVPLTVTRGTSEDGDHGSLASITLPAGVTSATGTVSTVEDGDGDDETFTVALGSLPSGLTAGTASSVEVTITDNGAQQQSTEPLTAAFENVPSAHDGTATFALDVRFSEALGETANAPAAGSFAVQGGKVKDVRQVESGLWRVRIAPKSWKDMTVTLAGGRGCGEAGAVCTADGRALTNTSTATIGGPVRIRVEGARAKEGKDASLDFAVTLNRAAAHEVSVDYATADDTATAGADYTATSGTLVFTAGETAKTVSVPVLDDAIDEGKETMRLLLSNPKGAYLRNVHRQAKGVIRNADPLPRAYLGHFGRRAASDAIAAVTARFETPRGAGSHFTFAGQRLSGDGAALADTVAGLARAFGAEEAAPGADPWNDPASVPGRAMTGRELLMGTSFRAVLDQGAGAQLTSWGQGASVSHFSGAASGVRLSGEAATGALGMDYERGRMLAGFALTHSLGAGTAHGAGETYALGSTVTTVLPYARLALTERLSAWTLAGTGSGGLTLDAAAQRHRTDLSMTLAAAGMRGDLVTPDRGGRARAGSEGGRVLGAHRVERGPHAGGGKPRGGAGRCDAPSRGARRQADVRADKGPDARAVAGAGASP